MVVDSSFSTEILTGSQISSLKSRQYEAFFQPLLTLTLGSKIPPPSVPCGIKWRYDWLIPSTGSWTSEELGLWHERKSGMKAHEDEDS